MRLDQHTCRTRLRDADHGVLSTLHPTRGIDAVPACFVLLDDRLCIPVDAVKPKASTRLQRTDNLEHDPRATLLVEHWDRDRWDRLWWVRAHLGRIDPDAAVVAAATAALRAKHHQYRDASFADMLAFEVLDLAGWSAAGRAPLHSPVMARGSTTTEGDTRTRLLEATISVLDEGGDAAVRVRDICEQVGVAATSLYHFFGSREGLIDEANAERYRRSFDWQQTELPERIAACRSRDDIRELLRGIIAMFATPLSEQRRAIRRAVLGSAVNRPVLAARLTEIDLEYARFMARLFAPAQRKGWVRRDVDLEALVMWQTAQGIARAIVDRTAGAVDLAEFDRISAEALVAVAMGEAPVERPGD